MAEDDEEEEKKHKSDKKSPHTALKSTDNAHTNHTNNHTNSSSSINKSAIQSGTSSSNYSNIHGIDTAAAHTAADRKPFQSTRDMRVVFVGKPFEMVRSTVNTKWLL